jgi:hypothetical protein
MEGVNECIEDVGGTHTFVSYGVRCGGNLLADLKLEVGACFRMTPSEFEVLLQMIGCKMPSANTTYQLVIPPSTKLS